MTGHRPNSSAAAYRTLAEVIADLHDHRRRMETLLARLDDLCRTTRVLPGSADRVEMPALVAQLSTNLRTDDGRLEQLVSRLERHPTPAPAGSER